MLLFISSLFTLSTLLQNTLAQGLDIQSLPKGAEQRIGKGWIRDIEFSPTGEKFAVATTIGVFIYDSHSSKEEYFFEDLIASGAVALSYSPFNPILAVAHEDLTIRLWNPTVKNQERPIPALRGHTGKILSVRFSPNGRILASASADNTIRLWNPTGKNDEEKLIAILPYKAAVRAIAFSPDNQLLVGGCDDGTLQVWDTGTGDSITEFTEHEDSIQAVDFSTDRTEVVSGSIDGTVLIWGLVGEDTQLRSTIQQQSRVYAVKFSPDGNTVATGAADKHIRLWNKETSKQNNSLSGHQDSVLKFDYSPNGSAIVSGSPDGRVLFWDTVGGRRRYEIAGFTGGIKALTYTEDKRIRACGLGIDGKLRIWDAGTGSVFSILREHIGLTEAVTFSKDGKTIASGGNQNGTIFISDVGKVIENKEGFNHGSLLTSLTGNAHGITALTFAPEDTTLSTGGIDGRVHLFDRISTNELKVLKGPQSTITALTFVDDSTRLFSGEENGTVRQWNGLTGDEIGVGFNAFLFGAITALTYSPTNKYLAIGDIKGRIQFFNPDTGKKNKMEFQNPHRKKVTVLIFSEDGKTLVSGSENGTIIIWDMDMVMQSPEVEDIVKPNIGSLPKKNQYNHIEKPELPAQEIARKARMSTLYLRTFNANGDAIGAGSGFYVGNGRIATNFHVINGASSIYARVVDKERWYLVENIRASDKLHDLAILTVPGLNIPALSLTNSDLVQIGEKVYAIGNPQGLEGTFSEGIISSIRGKEQNQWIQITAPISPGSSGGAILNSKCEVIGIATLSYIKVDPKLKINPSQNLNFAVPSNYLKSLISTMK